MEKLGKHILIKWSELTLPAAGLKKLKIDFNKRFNYFKNFYGTHDNYMFWKKKMHEKRDYDVYSNIYPQHPGHKIWKDFDDVQPTPSPLQQVTYCYHF